MRNLGLLITTALFASCNCTPPAEKVEVPPVTVSPSRVDFGRVWVGVPASAQVTVSNPARVTQPLSFSTSAPFDVPHATADISAVTEQELQVRVTATAPGALTGTLMINDAGVELVATAEEIPLCTPSAACRVSVFSLDAGACAETDDADGVSCTSSFACFASAECHAGTCLGVTANCDDGNACTLDVCGEEGCAHFDDTLSCPLPANPCLAPTCSATTGCGSIPVTDGTPCGPRDCAQAAICLDGQCQTRNVPQTQACAEVVAGVPAGPGIADGTGLDARFSNVTGMAYAPNGDLFLSTAGNGITGTIRRVSPNGTVRTIAGGVIGNATVDGYGSAAGFQYPTVIGLDSTGALVVLDVQSNEPAVRRVSQSGLTTTVCVNCLPHLNAARLIGDELFAISYAFGTTLTQLSVRTGAVRTWSSNLGSTDPGPFASIIATTPLTACGTTGKRVTIEPHDAGLTFAMLDGGCEPFTGIQRYLPDGSRQTLAITGPSADGPVTTVGLGASTPVPFAFDDSGSYALYDPTRWHVRRVESDVMRTLAGPIPRVGLVDGPVGQSQLTSSPAALTTASGALFFADGTTLRRLDGVIASTVVSDAGTAIDLSLVNGQLVWAVSQPASLTYFELDGQLGSKVNGTGTLTSIAPAPDAGMFVAFYSTIANLDAGTQTFVSTQRVRAGSGSVTAYVKRAVNGPWEFYVLHPGENLPTMYATPDAGFARLTDFFEESDGVVLGINGRAIYRFDTVTRQRTQIMELSETASSITSAPDGAYVGVNNAILYLHTH